MLVQRVPSKLFSLPKQDVQNIPFIIGMQTPWVHLMMVKHSHNNVMSMDSTFSTNKYGVSSIFFIHLFNYISMLVPYIIIFFVYVTQYHLYTLMVFDKHRNGVPVAQVISSRNTTNDICKWMSTLIVAGKKEQPNWDVKVLITDDVAAEIEALQ